MSCRAYSEMAHDIFDSYKYVSHVMLVSENAQFIHISARLEVISETKGLSKQDNSL